MNGTRHAIPDGVILRRPAQPAVSKDAGRSSVLRDVASRLLSMTQVGAFGLPA